MLLTRVRLGFLDTIVDEFASESERRWMAIANDDGSTIAIERGRTRRRSSIESDPDAGRGDLGTGELSAFTAAERRCGAVTRPSWTSLAWTGR